MVQYSFKWWWTKVHKVFNNVTFRINSCHKDKLNLSTWKHFIHKQLILPSFVQMRFYFHMSGDGIGTLSVFRKSQGNLHLLLNLTGDQGNYWQMREIPLSYTRDFRVTLEGKVGRNPTGDICLDDITFSPGCLLAHAAEVEDNTPPPSAGIHITFSDLLLSLCCTLLSYPPPSES